MEINRSLLENVYKHPLISPEQMDLICSSHEIVNIKKGDFLLKSNDIAKEYYILDTGVIRSFVHNSEGEDITIDFFVQNEIVIEVSSLFQNIPTSENIQALTDCICYKIHFQRFQELFHSIEGFREWGRAWLSESLFRFKQRSVTMITHSAIKRYRMLLEEKRAVFQYAPLKNIATYLGITDTSLSRIRKELSKK